MNETRFGPKYLDTFWCTGWVGNCQIIFRLVSIHGRACFILCEHQRALYGIKCVYLGFFNKHGYTYWWIIFFSMLCKHVPCSTLTHSTNEDLLNMKRKGDPKSSTLSRTSDTTETRNPCVIKVILLACFYYIDIF